MKEFNEYGEHIEPKKKKRNLFSSYTKDGKEIPFNVAVNDKVLITKYGGTEVTVNGTTYTILNESDILAIID